MPFCPFTNFTLVPCLHYSLRVLGTDTDPADPWPIFGGGRTPISLLWMFLLLLGIIFLLLKLGAFVLFDLERLNFRFHVASVFFVFCFLSGRSNVWRLVIIVMDTRGLKSQFSVNRHLRLVCASIANRVGHGWGPSVDRVWSGRTGLGHRYDFTQSLRIGSGCVSGKFSEFCFENIGCTRMVCSLVPGTVVVSRRRRLLRSQTHTSC